MRFRDPRGPFSAMHSAEGQLEEACGGGGPSNEACGEPDLQPCLRQRLVRTPSWERSVNRVQKVALSFPRQ